MTILKKAPPDAPVLDLGAARAARAEVRAKDGKANPLVKLSAGYVEVKAEVELSVAFDFQASRMREGLTKMLVDPDDVDAILADGLSAQDLNEIAQFTAGMTLGELQASPKS